MDKWKGDIKDLPDLKTIDDINKNIERMIKNEKEFEENIHKILNKFSLIKSIPKFYNAVDKKKLIEKINESIPLCGILFFDLISNYIYAFSTPINKTFHFQLIY